MTTSCFPAAPTSEGRDRVDAYMALVRRSAHRFVRRLPSHVQVDDLIGAGNVGLLQAARRYDPSQGARFETFAEHHIRGAMLDAVRSADPLSRDVRRIARGISRATTELRRRLGREPDEADVAAELGLPVDRLRSVQVQLVAAAELPLHATPRGEGDDRPTIAPPAPADTDPAQRAETHELTDRLRGAIAELPERLQTLVALYYTEGCTLKQIGERMGFTESRACQLHGEAIHRLRARFSDARG
ncbi:MAG: RNA polymerase sigma factor FliA [Deltaproteobacteria bacterium]|nr:RNA polymerase sigma factor FliA [Deltaproteobacteria bacterium]